MGWARAPMLRFVAMGAALFAGARWWASAPVGDASVPREIVITAAHVEQLRSNYVRETGLRLTPDAEAALVRRAIDEELLYREALARRLDRDDRSIEFRLAEQMHFLEGEDGDAGEEERARLAHAAFAAGLDRDDAIIRRMLIEKMSLLAVHNATRTPPSEADIQRYFDAHADQFRRPEAFTFWHVFLAHDRRGAAAARDAHMLRATFEQDSVSPQAAATRGDGFAVGPHVVAQSAARIRTTFGAVLADALMDFPLRTWAGPIASPYGLHLVWMEERTPAQLPPIERVRAQIVRQMRAARYDGIVRELITELERVYTVRVEPVHGGAS